MKKIVMLVVASCLIAGTYCVDVRALAPCAVVNAMSTGVCESDVQVMLTDYLTKGGSIDEPCHDGMGHNDWTVLMFAIKEGYANTVSMLLEKGANPNVQDKEGWTPLMMAATTCQNKLMSMLLAKGADPKKQNNQGKTAYEIVKIKDATLCQIPKNRDSERACALKDMAQMLQQYSE